MRRIWNTTLVVIAVIVFAIAGYVLLHHDTPSTGTSAAAPVDLPTTPPASAPPGSTATPPAHRLVVAFLGDDWTAGVGASSPAKRFTTLVSKRLHVTERNFGADGSGYAVRTGSGGTYASRVDDVVAAHPDVVVVSGGRNDYRGSGTTAATRAQALFAELHDRLPDARLIAIAPFWGDSDLPPEMSALGRAVNSAVVAAGGTYLAIADPIHNHPEFMADAGDPDDRGYAALAAAVEPRLAPLLES